ncbi:MAG: YcxB family protein [Butyricicoccaceae bacterium]
MDYLFKTTTDYSFEEYKKFNLVIWFQINKMHRTAILTVVLIAVLAFALEMPILYLGVVLFLMFLYLFTMREIKSTYQSSRESMGKRSELRFYPDHLEGKSKIGESRVAYSELYCVIETKTNIYLMTSRNQGFIVVKENCSEELLAFLRSIQPKQDS